VSLFSELQDTFVKAIKDPSTYTPANDDEARRMAIYQSLFFNNINGFVSSGFPVLKSLMTEAKWEKLVRHFFTSHSCRTPFFAEISKEFVEYLSSDYVCDDELPPFAAELAHYEWLELDISIRKTERKIHFFNDDILPKKVCVSPLATLASYTFPVHLIGPDYQPDVVSNEPQFYVVYRDSASEVQFSHLNSVSAMLFYTIEQDELGVTIEELQTSLVSQLPQIPEETVVNGMRHTLFDMLTKGMLLTA